MQLVDPRSIVAIMINRPFRFFRRQKTISNNSFDPDEIFLDASNLPSFDTDQLEGRLERPIGTRAVYLLGICALLIGGVVVFRLGTLQIVEGTKYMLESEDNRLRQSTLFADRGVLFDRNGIPLAFNVLSEDPDDEFSSRAYATSTSGLSHVLGYLKPPRKDDRGVYYQTTFEGTAGSELLFESELRGVNGSVIIETDAHNAEISKSVIRSPRNGSNVNLAIDAKVTKAFFSAIRSIAVDRGFVGGAGLLMDIKTGEIIVLTSYPEYDNQALSRGDGEALSNALNDPGKPFLNRAVSGLYTPGSIVKPFVAIGALNEKVITPEKEILSTGVLTIPNPYNPLRPYQFVDWRPHGWVSVREAIALSSNIYFYEVGGGFEDQKGIGISGIEKYFRLFGLSEETGIGLSEGRGTIPNPSWKAREFDNEPWRLGDTYNTAIGQYGVQVTPIQMVRAIAAIANGGSLVRPTLRKASEGVILSPERTITIPEQYFQIVREGMRQGVIMGTAQGLSVPGVSVAAKTGTAQVGVKKDRVNSWTIGFFPYDNPRYAFTVLMENGPAGNTIGAVAVMRQFLDWLLAEAPEYTAAR